MTDLPKEGAGRPLYESAPRIQAAAPAVPWLWAAAASYPLAYLYVRKILFVSGSVNWGLPVFTLLFAAGVEILARALHRKGNAEAPLWAGCWLVLSCTMFLWGKQPVLGGWQALVWHLFAVWFVLARCGMLAQGYTGSLFFLDGLAGFVTLPFGNFFRRIAAVGAGLMGMATHRDKLRRCAVAFFTFLITLLLCGMAWQLLSAADANFAALGRDLNRWLNRMFDSYTFFDYGINFLLSLPVGAWLYGLVAGSLHREAPPCSETGFFTWLEPLRRLPAVTARVAVGALCAIYTLFFVLQAAEWLAATPLGLTAPAASAFAVDGFWELLRILLLDFCVLGVVRFLGRRPLPKVLAGLFCLYGVAFAALAGAKLFMYIHLFGYTPRRVVAGWFLGVLAIWAVLLLIRTFRVFPSVRIGLAVLAISFVLLSGTDMQSRIVHANIGRYAAGVDTELDLDVLQECGLNSWYSYDAPAWNRDGRVVRYTGWLIDSGWFQNRTIAEIGELYDIPGETFGYERQAKLGQNVLRLTFDEQWRCTEVSLTPVENGV